jgi:hypothetical protein
MENFMDSDQAWVFIKQFVLEPIGAEIDQLRENLFKSAWDGKTYEAIAEKLGYEGSYIRDRGSRLLRSIGQAINYPTMDKRNFRQVIEAYCAAIPIEPEVTANYPNISFMGRSEDLLALDKQFDRADPRCRRPRQDDPGAQIFRIPGLSGAGDLDGRRNRQPRKHRRQCRRGVAQSRIRVTGWTRLCD